MSYKNFKTMNITGQVKNGQNKTNNNTKQRNVDQKLKAGKTH